MYVLCIFCTFKSFIKIRSLVIIQTTKFHFLRIINPWQISGENFPSFIKFHFMLQIHLLKINSIIVI